jgi:hypothetical protein
MAFVSTPKTRETGIRIRTVLPQLLMQGLLAAALVWRVAAGSVADAPAFS